MRLLTYGDRTYVYTIDITSGWIHTMFDQDSGPLFTTTTLRFVFCHKSHVYETTFQTNRYIERGEEIQPAKVGTCTRF